MRGDIYGTVWTVYRCYGSYIFIAFFAITRYIAATGIGILDITIKYTSLVGTFSA